MPEEAEPPANAPQPGEIVWQDLTVPDAAVIRDFYAAVVGWEAREFEGDFNMGPPGWTQPQAGICYARGVNAALPPEWLLYIVVDRLDERIAEVRRRGGTVVDGPRPVGPARLCVVRDPAGACVALFEPGA